MHDVDIQVILFELFTGSIKSFGTLYCLTCDEINNYLIHVCMKPFCISYFLGHTKYHCLWPSISTSPCC